MAIVTSFWKQVDEDCAKVLHEKFDTDREAREFFNSAVIYYTSCAKEYEFVEIFCKANGRVFNFNFVNGDMEE